MMNSEPCYYTGTTGGYDDILQIVMSQLGNEEKVDPEYWTHIDCTRCQVFWKSDMKGSKKTLSHAII